jgi:2,3-bisphosphoglycerate-independent phosphoglycerate mutase
MRKRTLVLAILDGWGIGNNNNSNPIYIAEPKNIDYIKHTYPAGTLQASGISVGLPWGEKGDSSVGHLTIGAGKVLYQHLPRINLEIQNGSFFKNEVLLSAISHTRKYNSRLHIAGLIGENNINSSLEHIYALLRLIDKKDVARFSMHIFTDGKDSSPKSASNLVEQLPKQNIASISGRYFAMDRDFHWDKTIRTYNVLVNAQSTGGNPVSKTDPTQLLETFYGRGITDEFIEPTVIDPEQSIQENDAIIFFNFREDSMRQLIQVFTDPEIGIRHTIPKNLYITTFTKYSNASMLPVAFPADTVINPIGKVISDNGGVQLRIAETERYAHVTYFFNGFVEQPFMNEYRVLIPSLNLAHPDEHPEMMARQVTTRVLSGIGEGVYDFILVNYSNPDVIAHTGNFDAAIKAIQTTDEEIGKLMNEVLNTGSILVITSDHGNAEQMMDPATGISETTHSINPVPIYVVTKGYERTKNDDFIARIESDNTGVLSDVAPTMLELMGIKKPDDMSGISLLQSLR